MNTTEIINQLKTIIGQPFQQTPSAAGRWLNGTLVAVEEGKLSISYVVRKEMTNPAEILHGGFSAAMLDEVMGMLVYIAKPGDFYASLNLNLDYLGAAKLNELVTVTAEIVKVGRTTAYVEGKLTNADGKLLVKAHSNLLKSHFVAKEASND